MKRLTYEGNFCRDVVMCDPAECLCGNGGCFRKKLWERLKEYEDTGLSPDEIRIMSEKGKYMQ